MARHFVPLLLASIPLAGCALFTGSAGPEVAVRAIDNGAVAPQAAGAEALAAGREAMRGGNVMAAMSAFRIAQRDPASAAEATNGLGVAWATLGRHDLAEKAFLEAAALAPRDRRFAANLERVLAHKALPAVPAAELPQQFAASQPVPVQAARPVNRAVQVEIPGNSMVRVSRTEVRIGAGNTAARPAMSASSSSSSRQASAAAGGPVIRVALPRAGDRVYPLRVALPAASGTRRQADYPLRVALRPPKKGTSDPAATAD